MKNNRMYRDIVHQWRQGTILNVIPQEELHCYFSHQHPSRKELMEDKIEVFIASDKEDVALLRELKKHLRSLETQGLITIWDVTQIVGGTDWKQAINNQLKIASLILLLVSADFIASREAYNLAEQAVAKNAPPKVYVVPVLLHEVD